MSRLSEFAEKESAMRILENSTYGAFAVENFMGGVSFNVSPLSTLKIITASSIFGEPQYYRNGLGAPGNLKRLVENSIFSELFPDNKSVVEVFETAIDNALDYDFGATLDFALELRTTYLMRLNPSVIFMRAISHPKRKEFNENNPGKMKEIGKKIAERPDDLTNQFEYYMFKNGTKANLPSVAKRTWSERLEEFSRYQLNKYKGKRLIDLVRISHANSPDINELMKTGKISVTETEMTWEMLRSEGKSWKEILDQIKMPHMALLRNLRGIFDTANGIDFELGKKICQQLKDGVLKGKQFPFRYWSAYKAIAGNELDHKQLVMDTLEECIDISVSNMPKLNGKTICLSDNSGSSWGAFTSEYGKVKVAEIANLSSLITALQSDEGEVGVFGDNLSIESVSKRNGLLQQLQKTSERGLAQGGSTENGIWVFFDEAIKNKTHYDNIFIYSDMQAGHGMLYGFGNTVGASKYAINDTYVDVLAMVRAYRKKVNPKVNIFSVQVSGYNNNVLPENLYRGAILSGWTGKEPIFAKAIIDTWNEIENQ